MAGKAPPGQIVTGIFPVLSATSIPQIDLDRYRFRVFGAVKRELSLSWKELTSMPMAERKLDFHCVTHWSRLGDSWTGVLTRDILEMAGPTGEFAMQWSSSCGYSANTPISYLMNDDAMLATGFNGRPLEPKHGGPVRAMVPGLYAWKSAKWIDGIEVMEEDRPGFWEVRGYNMHGDPWKEERYSGPNISEILKGILEIRQKKDLRGNPAVGGAGEQK